MNFIDSEFRVPGVYKIVIRDTFGEKAAAIPAVNPLVEPDVLKDAMNTAALASGLGREFFK